MNITEMARRVARYLWIERRLFEIVGAWSADERDADAVRVLAAEARHHAWRAGMWAELAPLLHDVDRATLGPSLAAVEGFDALTSLSTTIERVTALVEVVLPSVERRYESELDGADPVSDAPVIRVLQLLSLDAQQDWGAAAQLRHSVVRTEEDKERAAATQSWLEVLLLPCWEV
jgi:hypothetical protein